MGLFSKKTANPAPSAPPHPSVPPAPAGYSAYLTTYNGEQRWYFVNNATGQSSWTLPGQTASAPAPPPQPRPSVASSAGGQTYTAPWERNQAAFVKKYYGKTKGPGPKDYRDDPRYANLR